MNDYQATVCTMVHDLRVKDCEATRLILCDLLEEKGRSGVEDRTTKHLRAGKMVLASLDIKAIHELGQVSSRLHGRLSRHDLHTLAKAQGHREFKVAEPTITPAEYVYLWQVVVKYDELGGIDDGQVCAEARKILLHPDFVSLPEEINPPIEWDEGRPTIAIGAGFTLDNSALRSAMERAGQGLQRYLSLPSMSTSPFTPQQVRQLCGLPMIEEDDSPVPMQRGVLDTIRETKGDAAK